MPLEHINLARERANAAGAASSEGEEKFVATPAELRVIQEKMKDPKFVELMHEYMQSLEDPETRREEEAYLAQAEREAREGGDFSFEFVFPRPAFVVELLEPSNTAVSASELKKLGLPAPAGAAKLVTARSFLNVCTSDKIKAFTEHTTGHPSGSNWEVPVSVSQRRTEAYRPIPSAPSASIPPEYASLESVGVCVVHDVVFHPDTVSLAERSPRFMCFLVEIAVEHINSGYTESNNFPFRRLPSSVVSIGTPQNQTIRSSGPGKSPFDVDPHAPVLTRPTKHLPTGKENATTAAATTSSRAKGKTSPATPPPTTAAVTPSTTKATAPKPNAGTSGAAAAVAVPATRLPPYTIAHRGSIDLSEAWQWRVSDKRVGVPSELVVKLTFDGVRRAAVLDIAITPDGHALRIDPTEGQRAYEGLLVLPFTVEEVPQQAQFDCARGVLTLTLKVVPPPRPDGAPTAEELRRELQGGPSVGGDADADKASDTAEKETAKAPDADTHVAATAAAAAAAATPAAETSAAAAAASAPAVPPEGSTHGPEVSHIGDQDRVAAMMAQVRAAREAREAAAAAAAADEESRNTTEAEPCAAKPVDTTTTTTATAPAPVPVSCHAPAAVDAEEAAVQAVTAEAEAIPFLRKAPATSTGISDDSPASASDDVAALQDRQQAWAAMIAAEMEAARHREEAEAARAAQETEAQAARARRRVAAEQEQERLADRAKARRDALPLSNKYIFAID